jgi:hypothetical protein
MKFYGSRHVINQTVNNCFSQLGKRNNASRCLISLNDELFTFAGEKNGTDLSVARRKIVLSPLEAMLNSQESNNRENFPAKFNFSCFKKF